MKDSFFSSAITSIINRYTGTAITMATTVLLTRHYPASEVGSYLTAYGVANTYSSLAGFGAPEGAAKVSSDFERQGLSSEQVATTSHSFAIISSIALACAAWLIFSFLGFTSGLTIIWCAAWGITYSAGVNLIAIRRPGLGSFFFYTSGSIVLFFVVGGMFIIHLDSHLLLLLATCFYVVLAIAGTLTLLVSMSFRDAFLLKPEIAFLLVKAGWPFALGRFVQSTSLWLPVWSSSYFFGSASAASVGVIMRITVAAGAAVSATRMVMRRAIADYLNSGMLTRLSVTLSVIGSLFSVSLIAASALCLTFGNVFLHLIFGATLIGAASLLSLALVGPIIEAQWGITDDILKILDEGAIVIVVQCIGLFVQVAFLLIFHVEKSAVIFSYVVYTFFVYFTLSQRLRRKFQISIVPRISGSSFRIARKLKAYINLR